jgi:serine/threonine protein kinase
VVTVRSGCAGLGQNPAGRLNYPGVITVHDVIEYDSRPWIVMELFRGGSLADLIDKAGPLPPRRVAEIGLSVLDALCVAHAAGIVHRDIKPANVLVNGSRVVLTDFGAAAIQSDPALTLSGSFIGTAAYMARSELSTCAPARSQISGRLAPPCMRLSKVARRTRVLTRRLCCQRC